MTELVLAVGPTRYLGGSIETFALPLGAFIVIAGGLYLFFKRPHNVPRMSYLAPAHQTSTGTREPGGIGMIKLAGPVAASAVVAEAETGVPGLQPPGASETLQHPDLLPETDFTHPADESDADDVISPAGHPAAGSPIAEGLIADIPTTDSAAPDSAAPDSSSESDA